MFKEGTDEGGVQFKEVIRVDVWEGAVEEVEDSHCFPGRVKAHE